MSRRIFWGVFFFIYVIGTFYAISSMGIASFREPNLSNILADLFFLLGIIGFFSFAFEIFVLPKKVWKIVFWVYILYLLSAILLTSKDAAMIGANGVAYSEIAEEGWIIFLIMLAVVFSGTLILLYPLYKLSYSKTIEGKKSKRY